MGDSDASDVGTVALDAPTPDATTPAPPSVTTSAGTFVGEQRSGYQEFLGVPYAQPPLGALRWAAPRRVEAYEGGMRVSQRTPACPQGSGLGSEDCLYVHVHTPDPRPPSAPVMVWIHGGGLVGGQPLQLDNSTRGDLIARDEGVVVVSVAYRLGPLGFLAHPSLAAEDPVGASGNYGFLDVVAALEWLRDEIDAFGGDPGNVTVFGESAGGLLVCWLLVSPLSEGLFHRAVMQSGACASLPVPATSEAQGQRAAVALGCDGAPDVLACMRAAPVGSVLGALPPAPVAALAGPDDPRWGPNLDGVSFTTDPMVALENAEQHPVPTIGGWNLDEGTFFVWGYENAAGPVTRDAYASVLRGAGMARGIDSALIEAVIARHAATADTDPRQALVLALNDVVTCSLRRSLALLAARAPTYRYEFVHRDAPFQLPTDFPLGAYHGAEIQYVFGHPARLTGPREFSGPDAALHEAMRGHWAQLARTGSPDFEGAVPWPAWAPESDRSLRFDAGEISEVTAAGGERCAYWDAILDS